MSADNEIVILRTDAALGFEFRVEEMSASDNLFWHADETDHSPNWPFINVIFGRSQVFTTYDDALKRTSILERERQFLEYGVQMVTIASSFQHIEEDKARRLMEADHVKANQRMRRQHKLSERKRLESQIELGSEDTFEATAVHGYLVRKDGSRIHGSLSLQDLGKPFPIDPTKIGLKLKFQPSDW